MSFVSHSARTVTVNDNNDNNDNYSNSDRTATTTSGVEANNDNTNNGSASPAGVMVLRLAIGHSSSRRSGRSPTAAAAAGVSLRSGGGIRRGILKRPPRTISSSGGEAPYVPARVPEIIANVEDARIPVERDSDLTAEKRAARHQRGLAIRRATATWYYTDRKSVV